MPATKRLSISEFHRLVAVSEPAGGEEALPRGPSGDVGRRAVRAGKLLRLSSEFCLSAKRIR